MQGSLLAPPRKFGGVLAGAAGTVKKAKEGTAFSRALIREEEVEAGHSDPGVRYAPAPAVQAFRRISRGFPGFCVGVRGVRNKLIFKE